MSVTPFFPNLLVEGAEHEFSHLVPFAHTLHQQGGEKATITVRVSFKSHVFSESVPSGAAPDFRDENGKGRCFCADRYARSRHLPGLCLNAITANAYTWVSKDRNSISSLVVTDDPLNSGVQYNVIYYLYPSTHDDYDVELLVKSAYVKDVDVNRIKRRYSLLSLIRSCFFKNETIPK